MPSSHCCRSPEQPDRLDDNCASCWHSQVCRWAPAGVGRGAGLVKAPLSLYIPVLAAHLEVQGSREGEVPLRGSTPNRQPWVDCSVFPPLCPVSSTALAMAGLAQGPAAVWSPQGFGEDRDIVSQLRSGYQRSQAQPSWSWEQPCGTEQAQCCSCLSVPSSPVQVAWLEGSRSASHSPLSM